MRSGLLVAGLLNKYQNQGIPSSAKGNYMLWQIFGARFYIPQWFILGINILAVALGGFAFYRSRKERLQSDKKLRVKFSGFKLLLSMVISAVFLQFGEVLLFMLSGSRLAFYPALSLLALSLSIFLPVASFKIVLLILSAWPMIRLMFFQMFPLGARSLRSCAKTTWNSVQLFFRSGF